MGIDQPSVGQINQDFTTFCCRADAVQDVMNSFLSAGKTIGKFRRHGDGDDVSIRGFGEQLGEYSG